MQQTETRSMLELLLRPGFSVRENLITDVNTAAQALLLSPGMDIRDLLLTGQEEYTAFTEGCLYLQLSLAGHGFGCSVTAMENCHIFVLDAAAQEDTLRAFSMAAMELRQPLHTIMISADKLSAADSRNADHWSRLSRGLNQLHRIINNMSDAGCCAVPSRQSTQNLSAVLEEVFEKAKALVCAAGIELRYSGLSESVLSLADRELLERAVLNLVSNAVKFAPRGSCIQASLSRRGSMLHLSITDQGEGIPPEVLGSVFSRYLRQPGLEDSRFGLGLGIVLVRAAAAAHGGTVLIDQPQGFGTRVTMTLAIRQGQSSHVCTAIDLPGGLDTGLLELSDCLPPSAYEK